MQLALHARLARLAPHRALALALVLAACGGAPDGPRSAPAAPPEATSDAPVVEAAGPEAPASPPPACDALSPRATPLELSVMPDAGPSAFTSVIARATRTLRVMVYQMGTGPILDTLEAKARAGVDVRVILDVAQTDTNAKYKTRLEAAGAKVLWSDPKFTFMHAKVMIADEAEAVLSTGNYAAFRMGMERNFVVRDADAEDLDVLVKLFDADFARVEPDLSCTRLIVSPVNARDRIVDLIASAKRTIVVESMQLGDKDVRSALGARKAAGVDVRVLLADPSWIDANADAARFLAERGIPARWMKTLGVHAKAIAVDGEAAFVGSVNLSWTSLTKNREVGVIATEPQNVGAVEATFETDWATATPF